MEVSKVRCVVLCLIFDSSFSFQFDSSVTFDCAFVVKEHLRLKSRYKERVQAAIEYMKMIDDFDDLVDPRTLACHFLGLESSCALSRSKRKVNFALIFFFFLMYLLSVMQR